MAFAFTVEDGTGLADANAYADLSYVHDYHHSRGQLADWDGTAVSIAVTAVDAAADALTIDARHILTGDGPVTLVTTGVLPSGLAALTEYWLIKVSATQVKLATSSANAAVGTAVDITAVGSGDLSLSGPDFEAQRAAIVRATDYIEQTFGSRFHGVPSTDEQALFWPADGVYIGSTPIEGVPDVVKRACAEYALRARSTDNLAPEGAAVTSESRSQGGISRSVTYAGTSAVPDIKRYPVADKWLKPLLRPVLLGRA